MRVCRFLAVLLLGVVCWAIPVRHARDRADRAADLPAFDPQKPLTDNERDRRIAALEPGLSPEQVRRLIGDPRHTGRQILYHRCLEQWLYEGSFSLRLEFDWPRGQEPRLQSVQPAGAPGR